MANFSGRLRLLPRRVNKVGVTSHTQMVERVQQHHTAWLLKCAARQLGGAVFPAKFASGCGIWVVTLPLSSVGLPLFLYRRPPVGSHIRQRASLLTRVR